MNDISRVAVNKCMNILCLNMVNQGSFDLVTISLSENQRKNITLLMCSPCAKALDDWSNYKEIQ